MSDRERWIVYPLVFLALGTALRDKLFRTINTDHIVCRSLEVDGRLGLRITKDENDESKRSKTLIALHQAFARRDGKLDVYGSVTTYGFGGRKLAELGPVVRCKALAVVDDNNLRLTTIGPEKYLHGEEADYLRPIKTFDRKARSASQIGPAIVCREIKILDAEGKPQVLLAVGNSGGLVTTLDQGSTMHVSLGHFTGGAGLVASTADGETVRVLSLIPHEAKPKPGDAPEPEEAEEGNDE